MNEIKNLLYVVIILLLVISLMLGYSLLSRPFGYGMMGGGHWQNHMGDYDTWQDMQQHMMEEHDYDKQ